MCDERKKVRQCRSGLSHHNGAIHAIISSLPFKMVLVSMAWQTFAIWVTIYAQMIVSS